MRTLATKGENNTTIYLIKINLTVFFFVGQQPSNITRKITMMHKTTFVTYRKNIILFHLKYTDYPPVNINPPPLHASLELV